MVVLDPVKRSEIPLQSFALKPNFKSAGLETSPTEIIT